MRSWVQINTNKALKLSIKNQTAYIAKTHRDLQLFETRVPYSNGIIVLGLHYKPNFFNIIAELKVQTSISCDLITKGIEISTKQFVRTSKQFAIFFLVQNYQHTID